jgi:putative Mn2+ efflux pump MntP
MIETIILAIALSMDAFAVAIGLGAKDKSRKLGLTVGLYFGGFQALMPFIGFLFGKSLLGWVESYAHWIAFALLALIGTKMIHEALTGDIDEDIPAINYKTLFMLSIATSIDALAAGFSLNLLDINPGIACVIIGITTFAFSWSGVRIGRLGATWLESKAEVFGGVVLILIGVRILVIQ